MAEIKPSPGRSRRDGPSSRRAFLQRSAGVALAVPAVAAGASAWLHAARPAAARSEPGTLIIADNLKDNWDTLDPARVYGDNPMAAMNVIYETLYHLPDVPPSATGPAGPDLGSLHKPLLAADFPGVSADGRELTIPLRRGVTFQHTGNEMTAEDWVFSWRRLGHMRHRPFYFYAEHIAHVEAIDTYTLGVRLIRPNVAIVALLSAPQFSVTDRKAVIEHGGVTELPLGETDPALAFMQDNSAGTGPYQLVRFDVDSEVVVERNPRYWGEAPKLEQIVWRQTLPDAQVGAVLAGEADVAYTVEPGAIARLEGDPSVQVLSGASLQVGYLALSMRPRVGGPLAIKELRQAIGHAIDYDGILTGLAAGRAVRPATVVPFGLLGAAEVRDKGYRHNLARARELFHASGLGTATLTLAYSAGEASPSGIPMEALVAKIRDDLQQIEGLTVVLEPMEGARRFREYREGRLQFNFSNWSALWADVHYFALAFGHTGGDAARRLGYANPALDALLAEGIAERDVEKRARIYAAIQEQFIEDAVYLTIEQPEHIKVAAANVRGVQVHPMYQLQLRHASKA